MRDLFAAALAKLHRDRDQPVHLVARKGATYLAAVALAPLWLRAASRVGAGVRTIGRPRIENLGYLGIGDRVLLRSTIVPIELTAARGARLVIGADTFINYGASIGATGSIDVGARVNIGPYAMIIDTHFHDAYDRSKVPPPEPVVIEDDVFLGAKCSIMPGVHIGRAAIVGTSAVVTKDVAAFSVVAGVPAREIARLDPARFVVRP